MKICFLVLVLILCSCNKITFEVSKPLKSNAVSGRLTVEVGSSSYPLTLNFAGLRISDQIYVLRGTDHNCNGGKDIGFDFVPTAAPTLSSKFPGTELTDIVRVLVINDGERICTDRIGFNLSSSTYPIIAARPSPSNRFRVDSSTPVGILRPTQPMNDSLHLVDSGNSHTCAIQIDGSIKCWGRGTSGQLGNNTFTSSSVLVNVIGINNAIEISMGGDQSCALLSTGKINCWGYGEWGQLGNNKFVSSSTPVEVSTINSAVSIAVGGAHSCALLADGKVNCWGGNWAGQLGTTHSTNSSLPVEVLGISNPIALSLGTNHACTILPDHTLKCWGDNSKGQLGNNSLSNSSTPVDVIGIDNAIGVSLGGTHSCALLSTGRVNCWGRGTEGQLGNNIYSDSATAVEVSGITNAVGISLGYGHSCALLATGTVQCWGRGSDGRLGNNTTANSAIPVNVSNLTNVQAVISAGDHSCAILTAGMIKCWGQGAHGQIGNASTSNVSTPVMANILYGNQIQGEVLESPPLQSIEVGGTHICSIQSNKKVKCWGYNSNGQLGNNSTTHSAAPVEVQNITQAQDISLGQSHSCAVLADGKINCWGYGQTGQLGNGGTLNSSVPVEVSGVANAMKVSLGNSHACAVLSDGKVNCWGEGGYGKLGNNSTSNSTVPVEVTGITDAIGITLGNGHSCALLSSGKVNCWGQNGIKQLGNNSSSDSFIPVEVFGLTNAVDIVAGAGHTCAILSTGKVSCWGQNNNGQLGNNSIITSSAPVEVSNINNAVRLSLGDSHSCALLATGKINCWGHGTYGELGNNSNVNSLLPVEVSGISNSVEIASGSSRTCTILSSGTIKCWGPKLADAALASYHSLNGFLGLAKNDALCFILSDRRVQCAGYGELLGISVADSAKHYTLNQTTPIIGLSSVTKIQAGGTHFCALTSGGNLSCWGQNDNGQLGVGNTNSYSQKQDILIGSNEKIIDFAMAYDSTCAATEARDVYCWGSRFGDTPTKMNSLSMIKKIWAAQFGSEICAQDLTEKVYCIGDNSNGQLAYDPNLTDYFSDFEEIPNLQYLNTLTIYSYEWGCGTFNTNQELKCWGSNWNGQLGIDPNITSYTFNPISTSIDSVTKVFIDNSDGDKTYYLREGQLYGFGVDGLFTPYQFKLGAIQDILHASSGLFYATIKGDNSLVTYNYFLSGSDHYLSSQSNGIETIK